jgi:hypothetical protein
VKHIVGYYIRRTWKTPPHPGTTLHNESHRVYPTREAAEEAMADKLVWMNHEQFNLDVAPAWMITPDEERP